MNEEVLVDEMIELLWVMLVGSNLVYVVPLIDWDQPLYPRSCWSQSMLLYSKVHTICGLLRNKPDHLVV